MTIEFIITSLVRLLFKTFLAHMLHPLIPRQYPCNPFTRLAIAFANVYMQLFLFFPLVEYYYGLFTHKKLHNILQDLY